MNLHSSNRTKVQPLRTRLREETNRAILEAAEQVFGSQGPGGARMEDIAARAGVAVGTLYNHFEDREALLVELLASRREELARRLDEELRRSNREDFRRQLAGFVGTILTHFEEHRPFFSVLLEAESAGASPSSPRRKRQSAALAEIFERAQQLIQRGISTRALREDSDLLATFLLGLVRGVLVQDLYVPARAPVAERAPQIVEFFLRGAARR